MKFKLFKFMLPMVMVCGISMPAYATEAVAPDTATDDYKEEETDTPRYVTFHGTIKSISETDDHVTVIVDAEDENTMIYNIFEETKLFSLKTKEPIHMNALREGEKVSVSYGYNIPMTASYPPQVNPEVFVVHEHEIYGNVKVDFFDAEGLSSDKDLKINVSEKTDIEDLDGDKLIPDDVKDKNLIVFYTITTRSIPPQTPPEKIIVLADKEINKTEEPEAPEETPAPSPQPSTQPTEPVETTIPEPAETIIPEPTPEEIAVTPLPSFTEEQTHVNDNAKYIRLYDTAAELGYEISWNLETRTVTLHKGSATHTLTIGQKEYQHNETIDFFEHAPIIKDDRTFVEESFFEKLNQ